MEAIVEWNENSQNMSIHKISGFVKFNQRNMQSRVVISVNLSGLPDGFHGFHVHEKKIIDFDDKNVTDCCDKLGGHFNVGERWSLENQSGKKHGIGVNGHNGDLCNNIYSENGKCEFYFSSNMISLYKDDARCIIDRSIVIHEDEDDLGLPNYEDSEKNIQKYITGNAGKRIACGNIIYSKK